VRDALGWHLDPYTNNGESFYQLASNYTVRLDHPTSVLVPATGTSTDAAGSTGRTVTTATATNVREFAWGAGPFRRSSTTTGGGVKVNTYWTSAISSSTAASMQSTAVSAISGHGSRFGAYPYGEVDVLLHNNFWFGGMEYPGFILDRPSSTVIIHELGHQWFYGIVGDDEYNSPWLDEGFTDYATDIQRGISGTNCWNNVSWQSPAEKITNSMAYWDAHANRYGTVVYGYGKCALHDLRRLIGTTAMSNLLRGYAQSHWFGVSTVPEFKAAAQAATSVDLTSFWAVHRIEG
jgi:aminopeptidase N